MPTALAPPDRPSPSAPVTPGTYLLVAGNRPNAPTVLRRLVATVLCATGYESLAETARLLTSEIVTNVHRHTNTPAVHVEVLVSASHVHVSVRDNAPRYRAMPPEIADGEGGLGLHIVDKCADSWGITHFGGQVPTGKAVWFRLVRGGKGAA
ncbi:ATP-binding protein [Streptomyces longisporoflavus]|uniref:ATP-binding protein n=1 Tax=Streptomyces longisporoflavus TaxID=28044 RepID=A0ABW7R5W8_9ACTN